MNFKSLFFITILSFPFWCKAQDPFNMSLLSRWDQDTLPNAGSIVYNDCWGYVDCSGREYAILGSAAYTHFFDLSDPTNPEEIAHFEGGDVTIWRDFKTYKNYAYGVCDNCQEGLQIFDMSSAPDTIIRVEQTTEFWGACHNIFIDTLNGRLYGAGYGPNPGNLSIIDIASNPSNPQLIAEVDLPGGYVHDVYVRDDTAYCSHGNNGLFVYDLNDADNPQLLGSIQSILKAVIITLLGYPLMVM